MYNIVIDTNIVFSSFLSRNSKLRDVILNNEIFAPNFLTFEIFNHKEKILKYSKLNENELLELIYLTFEHINFVPNEIISSSNKTKAYNLCKNVDLNDVPFVALSLELNYPLFSGDKKLINHLKNQKFDLIFSDY